MHIKLSNVLIQAMVSTVQRVQPQTTYGILLTKVLMEKCY